MTEEKCIIHKVSVEVNAHTSMDTDTLQKEVHKLIEETILRTVDDYLSKKSNSVQMQGLRIDRLDLDLNLASLQGHSRLDTARMVEKQLDRFFLSLNLEEASARLEHHNTLQTSEAQNGTGNPTLAMRPPKERLAGTSSNGKPVALLSAEERTFETILHFLLEGTTPWWISNSAEMRTIVADEKLIELLDRSPVFRLQFRQYLKRSRFFERFTVHFAPTTVARVILFLADEKWADMAGFQRSFLAPLERLSLLTRSERTRFWNNLFRASALRSYPQWREKVLLESHRSFAERTKEQLQLLSALKALKLSVPSDLAALTIFLLHYQGKETLDVMRAWKEILKEIHPESHSLLLHTPDNTVVKASKKRSKKDPGKSSETTDASHDPEKVKQSQSQSAKRSEKKTAGAEKSLDQSAGTSPQRTELEQRFAQYRARMEARLKVPGKKTTTKKDDRSQEGLDPDTMWESFSTETDTRASEASSDTSPDGGWIAGQVGVLLVHPFLKAFCTRWELLDEAKQLKDPEAMAHILHFIATGREKDSEFEMTFEKFICGIDAETVLGKDFVLPDEMKENIGELLQSVITHWTALKSTSIPTLRGEFLIRPGKIVTEDSRILITMERKSIDLLIDRLPWTISYLKLPWRKEIVQITW